MLEDLVVWYLFLGGAGAGLLFATAVLEFLSPHAVEEDRAVRPGRLGSVCRPGAPGGIGRIGRRLRLRLRPPRRCIPKAVYGRFFGPAYGTGIAAVVMGGICLFLDLGRGERALALLFQPAYSFITVGVFSLLALILLAAVLFAVWGLGLSCLPKVAVLAARIGCAALSVVVMAYTGLFLSSMPSVAFWTSPWLPALFVASSVSAGLVLLVCVVVLTGSADEFAPTLRRIQKADALVIAGELGVLALFVVSGFSGADAARQSATQLVQGGLAEVFWGGVVVLGLAVPLVCEVANRRSNAYVSIAAGALVLVGGYLLRWCVSEAGVVPDLAASVMAVLGIQ